MCDSTRGKASKLSYILATYFHVYIFTTYLARYEWDVISIVCTVRADLRSTSGLPAKLNTLSESFWTDRVTLTYPTEIKGFRLSWNPSNAGTSNAHNTSKKTYTNKRRYHFIPTHLCAYFTYYHACTQLRKPYLSAKKQCLAIFFGRAFPPTPKLNTITTLTKSRVPIQTWHDTFRKSLSICGSYTT